MASERLLRPLGVEELAGGLIEPLVGVRAEEIALSLEQIRRKTIGTVAIEVGKRGAESRRGHPSLDRGADGLAPIGLRPDQDVAEEGRQDEVFQSGIGA